MIDEKEDNEDSLDLDDLDTEEVEITRAPPSARRAVDPESDVPEVGSWWWVDSKGDNDSWKPVDYDEPGKKWIACVVEVGSNYAKVEGVRFHSRIALDNFHGRCKPEPDPDTYIATKVGFHKTRVRALMGKIRQLCHQLGVPMRQALSAVEAPTQALAVAHGIEDVKAHKKALVKAKEKTLPELFEKVKAEHEQMAKWMKAELIPAMAELSAAKGVTEVIADKIHTVELYAGLQEQMVQVREGEPGAVDAKVHLMQRRHYMDEECLVKYEAGGMDFKDIRAFDKWMGRDENFTRLLPHERCIVAFRIRRNDKDYSSLNPFIAFWHNRENKATFLYIRNGRQLWRMETSVDFDEELFPNREDSDLLGDDDLWIKNDEYDISHGGGIITGRQRADMVEERKSKRAWSSQALWQWHRAGKPEGNWLYTAIDHPSEKYGRKPGEVCSVNGKLYGTWHSDNLDRDPVAPYERLTPENIYYDDAMKRIARAAFEHNRVAVIVQGLLDRSVCLHPHPPWRIWTAEGFTAGIVLVYDVSRALTPGEAPNWEGYRAQLNKSLKVGSHTIGQQRAWRSAMREKYGEDWNGWRNNRLVGKGPQTIDVIAKIWRDGSMDYNFTRDRQKPKWVDHPEKRGYLKASYPDIPMTWRCPAGAVVCVDAYTPGDFHMFFDDPRTRADYLKWAPVLLSCENWHHDRRNAPQVAGRAAVSASDDGDDEE